MIRRNKFNARKTVVDGITFDSQAEAARWSELRLLEKAGKIHSLTHHVRYALLAPVLNADHQSDADFEPFEPIGHYEADFCYYCKDVKNYIVEDVKGVMTPLARWKMKHFEVQYGMTINVVRARRR